MPRNIVPYRPYPKDDSDFKNYLNLPAVVLSEIPQQPTGKVPHEVGVKLFDYNPTTRELTLSQPDRFKTLVTIKKNVSTVMLVGTCKNLRGQLKELIGQVDSQPGRPWSIGGRDGDLIIGNKAVNRPIVKVYTWAGGNGELLSFSVDSKYIKNSVEMGVASDVDPDSKGLETAVTQIINDPDRDNADYYIPWDIYKEAPKIPADATRVHRYLIPERVNAVPNTSDGKLDVTYLNKNWGTNLTEAQSNPEKIYDSEADAITSLQANPGITLDELTKYLQEIEKNIRQELNPEDADQMDKAIHKLKYLPDYVIKRKVKVRKYIQPTTQDPERYAFRNRSIDAIGSAKKDEKEMVKAWQRGYKHMLNDPSIIIAPEYMGLEDNTNYSKGVETIQELTLSITIPGQRVLASENLYNLNVSMGNDIMETITNQIKAEASVVGDPLLESSMNFIIRNVSKYSGSWYAKKVTHKFSSNNAYICDITFVEREIPVTKTHIKADMVLKNVLGKTYDNAKKAVESWAPQKMEKLETILVEFKKSNLPETHSLVAVARNDGSGKVDLYDAEFDIDVTKKDGEPISYTEEELYNNAKSASYIGTVDVNQIPR